MYTPHTVTLYCVTENGLTRNIDTTILNGVFLDTTQGRNVNTQGTNNSNSATLFVPFSVQATSLSGKPKRFIDAKQYQSMPDPSRYWTLFSGGDLSAVDCYFVKGAVTETLEYREAKKHYPDVYKVAHVTTRDFGSTDMQHWQVSAE